MPTVSLSLDWIGDLRFRNSSGNPVIELDSGTPEISTPPQGLAYAVMACMAMDVVDIIRKGRYELRGMTVKLDGVRSEEHPRRFTSMRLQFDITGDVPGQVVERAIEWSRTKYCSVWNSIRQDVELKTSYRVRDN